MIFSATMENDPNVIHDLNAKVVFNQGSTVIPI